MPKPKVNYDQIASTYDLRFKEEKRSNSIQELVSLLEDTQPRMVLEVGCGTGHWLSEINNQAEYSLNLFGLDLSREMLSHAYLASNQFNLIQGKADSLPFLDRSFDLILCVNAIHHFAEPQLFIRDSIRLLQPAVNLAIIGMDPRNKDNQWYVYDFFPGTYETDLKRFPSWGTIMNWLIETGFERISWKTFDTIHETKYGSAVLEDPFLEKNACSQLALLSDQEYEKGLARIHKKLAEADLNGETLSFKSDIHLKILTAKKSAVQSEGNKR